MEVLIRVSVPSGCHLQSANLGIFQEGPKNHAKRNVFWRESLGSLLLKLQGWYMYQSFSRESLGCTASMRHLLTKVLLSNEYNAWICDRRDILCFKLSVFVV